MYIKCKSDHYDRMTVNYNTNKYKITVFKKCPQVFYEQVIKVKMWYY